MGNSEVGHLNLGAGRGRAPGPDAHRRRRSPTATLAENEVLRHAFPSGPRAAARAPAWAWSPTAACTPRSTICAPDRPRRASSASATWSCTRSPTAATRCPHAGADFLARARRAAATRAWARSSGATARWTATAAGSASSAPTTCSSTARRPVPRRQRRARPCGRPTSAARPTSSSSRRSSARRPRIRPGDSVHLLQLPARPHARDHARAGRARLRRGRARTCRLERPRRSRDVHALRDDDRATRRAGPTRWCSRPSTPSTHALDRARERPARASCTSPRPRSTRT